MLTRSASGVIYHLGAMVPIKRALEDHAVAATQPLKRRKVAHKLRYKQPGAILTTLIPQDHETVERELEKCIALALREAGFESYKPSAMASFRGQVNECQFSKLQRFRSQQLS